MRQLRDGQRVDRDVAGGSSAGSMPETVDAASVRGLTSPATGLRSAEVGPCVVCVPREAGNPGGAPLLVLRRAAPPPQQEGRKQERQDEDDADERPIVVPPIAVGGERALAAGCLRCGGRGDLRRSGRLLGAPAAASAGALRRLPRPPARPAPAPATPPAFARPAPSARRCAGAAPGSPLRSPPPFPDVLVRDPPRCGPGCAARYGKPRPVGGDGAAARLAARFAAARSFAGADLRAVSAPSPVSAEGPGGCAARVVVRAGGRAGRLASRAAGAGAGAAVTSRGAGSVATTGASIAGGSMNSVYSRRIVASQPAWSVRRMIGSFTGRTLVTTSAVPAAERSTPTRPNCTCGTPSASRSAATIRKHSDATFSPSPSVTGTTMRSDLAECGLLRDRAEAHRRRRVRTRAPARRSASASATSAGRRCQAPRTSGRAGGQSNRLPARWPTRRDRGPCPARSLAA